MSHRRPGKWSALVAGASGLVGRALVALLVRSGDYGRIHVLTRRTIRARGVREHLVDFDNLGESGADIGGIDHAFCCLGTTMRRAGSKSAFRRVDHDYVVGFGELASRLGARVLVSVSSLGADPESRNFYLRVKGETERDLGGIGLPAVVILRPSLLTGHREEFRPSETIGGLLLGAVSPLMLGPLKRARPVRAEQVAACMCAAARVAKDGVRVIESEDIRTAGHRCVDKTRPRA